MASNKLYKPGQLITVKCKESTMLCHVTKIIDLSTCNECEISNGKSISSEICKNINCARLGFRKYPKLVKQCKKV